MLGGSCLCCGRRLLLTRGLCRQKCHKIALRAVRNGRVTWAELEAADKAAPPKSTERGYGFFPKPGMDKPAATGAAASAASASAAVAGTQPQG